MSEITKAAEALSQWPVVNGFFIIVITFLGLVAWRRGEKENKNTNGVGLPTYLMAHDAAKALNILAEDSRERIELQKKTNALLEDLAKTAAHFDLGQIHTHRLLNAIRNEYQMRPTMAHPEKNGEDEETIG